MFSKSEFQAWGKANVVLFASVMTKIEGRKDDDLLLKYGFRGFPSMAVLDETGEALHKRIPRDFFAMRHTVAAVIPHRKIQRQVDAGEEYDENAWFMARLGLGKLSPDDAKVELAKLQLDADQMRSAEKQLLVMEMGQLLSKVRSRRGQRVSPEVRDEVCAAVYQTFKSGRRIPESSGLIGQFDALLIDAAKKNDDGSAYLYSYARVREEKVKRVKDLKRRVSLYQKRLDQYRKDEREQMVRRYESSINRSKGSIANVEKEIAELDAWAAKFRKNR